jgi:hypothetical protein
MRQAGDGAIDILGVEYWSWLGFGHVKYKKAFRETIEKASLKIEATCHRSSGENFGCNNTQFFVESQEKYRREKLVVIPQ